MSVTQPLRFFVVDDELAVLNLMGRLLETRGHKVSLCHAGTAALIDMPDPAPDCIITDINMIGVDGYELTRELRQSSDTSDTKIIAISADTDDETQAKILAAGANAFIGKPIIPESFAEDIEKLLADL